MGADQDIDAAIGKVVDDFFVGIFGACAVEVHAFEDGVGEEELEFIFDFFGSKTNHAQAVAAAIGARTDRSGGVAAIVAFEQIAVLVVGEADIAVLAARSPGANFARPNGGVASSILEQDNLLFFRQSLFHFIEQQTRKMRLHIFESLFSFEIGANHEWQLKAFVTIGKLD